MGESEGDPIHATRLWRAVRCGDVTELTKALPSVRGVDGHEKHLYCSSSPERGGASAGIAAASAQEPSRLPTWRPVSLAETDAAGQTVLHLAARIGNLGVVSMLLDRGAELNARDATGRTPVVLAARHGKAAVVAALVSAALRTERATGGANEDLESMLDREVQQAFLAMVHNAADAGDVVGVRSGLEAVATLVGKAVRVGDTLYIEKVLGAGLEIELSAAAALARRHSQTVMANFLESLNAARAPKQPSRSSAGQEGLDGGAADEDDEDDDEGSQPEHENRVASVAERLVQGEVRLLVQALVETDLAKIDRILATHRESLQSLPAEGSQMLGDAAGGRMAVRDAWQRLKRRRRELQREQRQNRDCSVARPNDGRRQLHAPHLCGICREVLRPPACQCAKGHIFCGQCLRDSLRRVPECPTCDCALKCRCVSPAFSGVPIDPNNPSRYLTPCADSDTNDEDTVEASTRQLHKLDEDRSGPGSMSETMKGGFDWLVESSDEEEAEAEFQRQLARVEAEAAKPPPAVTKQYLAASRRRMRPSSSSRRGVADVSSSVSTLSFSTVSKSADKPDMNVDKDIMPGAGIRGSSVAVLPPPRAKRRWQRADDQLQGYFTSLMASEQLAEPDVRVRRNISSRENRYRERIRRAAKPAGVAMQSAEAAGVAAGTATTTTATGKSVGVTFDQSGHRPPRTMLAFENITRRVQRTMEQQRLFRGQVMSREQVDASSESSAARTPVKHSRVPPRSVAAVRPVDKDPTVLGRLPIRFGGGRRSDLARSGPSDSGSRATTGRKAGERQAAGRGGDYSGDEALPSISPLRYKAGGAALKQQLELPPI